MELLRDNYAMMGKDFRAEVPSLMFSQSAQAEEEKTKLKRLKKSGMASAPKVKDLKQLDKALFGDEGAAQEGVKRLSLQPGQKDNDSESI